MKKGYDIRSYSLILLTIMVCSQGNQIKCHYSCDNCAGQSYSLCFDCADQNNNLTVVEDPKEVQIQFRNSLSDTGVCEGKVPSGVNAFGIIILIICVAVAAIVRTKQSVYLLSTLQNISLLSFIEIAWIMPSGYLLQSFQYFMIFNVIISGTKTEGDYTMKQRQFYRLHQYFKTSQFLQNISLIGILNLIIFLAMVVIAIWKWRKSKQKKPQQIYDEQENIDKRTTKQKIIDTIFLVLQTLFYFFILETSLVIMVSLRFPSQVSIITIVIAIIYCLMLLVYLIYFWFIPLWFSPNIPTQFINIWRKIALPVLVITPPQYHFLLFIFMFIFILAESMFDFNGGDYKLRSRITIYKILQLVVLILGIAFYLIEHNSNLPASSGVIRIFFSIFLLVFFICIFIQLAVGIMEMLFGNRVQNSQIISQQQRFETRNNLSQNDDLNSNNINRNNTLGMIEDEKDKDKQKLQIFDVQILEDDDKDYNYATKNQQQIEKQINPNDNTNDFQQYNEKDNENNNENDNKNDNKNNNENDNKNNNENDNKNDNKNDNENDNKNDDKNDNRNENQIKNKIDQNYISNIFQDNKDIEKYDNAKYQIHIEDMDDLEKSQEAVGPKIDVLGEQYKHKKDDEEEEIEEIKPRKKKAYKGQMDPQLRKRYGM